MIHPQSKQRMNGRKAAASLAFTTKLHEQLLPKREPGSTPQLSPMPQPSVPQSQLSQQPGGQSAPNVQEISTLLDQKLGQMTQAIIQAIQQGNADKQLAGTDQVPQK